MLAPQASKIRSPSRPSIEIEAKSFGFADRRAVGDQGLELQMAQPQRGWLSAGAVGRWT
jgi:hypothetical protein